MLYVFCICIWVVGLVFSAVMAYLKRADVKLRNLYLCAVGMNVVAVILITWSFFRHGS